MKLIVGLGNPGREYVQTRHNVGHLLVQRLVEHHGLTGPKTKFHSNFFQGDILGAPCVLLQPLTYMNRSGTAVLEAMNFYKLEPGNSLIAVDDPALACGQIRLRASGSAGGHNGLSDIERVLSTQAYPRLRIGIDHHGPMIQHEYVLRRFTAEQLERLEPALERARLCVESWTTTDIETVMSRYNASE